MTLQELAGRVEESLSSVGRVLSDLGVQLVALRAVGFLGGHHLDEMSRQLEGVARRALAGPDGVIAGVGVVWESADERGMLWWRADGGEVTRKIHVDNPASDSFYDFANSEWYLSALASPRPVIVGPYIDAWGTDDHALTPALAVVDADGVRVGVAAVDLDAYRATELLARVLSPWGEGVVLANADGQVIAANIPSLTAGLRLEPFLLRHRRDIAESVDLPAVAGWRLLRLADDPA